jgi:hexosaminidase
VRVDWRDADPPPEGIGTVGPVLGGQGNLWTEYVATNAHAEYMIFPRMLALSEALWSLPAAKSYREFAARLSGNANHLDQLGVNYARPPGSP